MTESVTLGYWNIRGLAQRIRLVLEYLEIPYNQTIFTPQTENQWFTQVKPQYLKKNPAANLPFLLDGDKLICQSEAIIIYLCHKAYRKDLLGENADEQVQIATVMGVYKDVSKTFSGYCYGDKPYEQFKTEAINSLKPGLDKLKGLLGDKEWFTGKLSYCDFIVGDFFQVLSYPCLMKILPHNTQLSKPYSKECGSFKELIHTQNQTDSKKDQSAGIQKLNGIESLKSLCKTYLQTNLSQKSQ